MTPTLTRHCAALATVAAAAFPHAAQATGDGPSGRDCDFLTVSNSGGVSEQYVGQVNGGPVYAPGATLTLRCSIHVGNDVHAGAADAVATAGPSDDVVVLPPEPVTYYADYDDVVALCTEATVDGTPWYWTGADWTTDPAAPCPRTTTTTVPPDSPPDLPAELDDVEQVVDSLWACLLYGCVWPEPGADWLVCPVLASAAPGVPGVIDVHPDGDVYLAGEFFWDCPPYEVWD